MATRLTPYLNFREGTRAAMEYYRTVFGGELTVSTFGETPGMGPADVSPNGTLTLSGDDEDKLRDWWDALSSDGTVGVPLEKAPWGDSFGMCIDRFGTTWLVNASGQPS